MPTVLVPCPTERDRLNLDDPGIRPRFDLRPAGDASDLAHPAGILDRLTGVDQAGVKGVLGARDATAHLAVHLAAPMGLPGPTTEAFMRCHDKLESRGWQRRLVPEATVGFFGLDPDLPVPERLPLAFPMFVKPITGHLSLLAFTVRDRDELEAVLARSRRELPDVSRLTEELEGRTFRTMIAEELVEARQVTFEGFMHHGVLTPIGVTDSVMHPNQISFLRFDYPSSLPAGLHARMAGIAERLMRGIGFDDSVFNIEFFVRPDGRVSIIEANGRMASQFSPLVKAVHGVSTYQLQLELATGGSPELPAANPDLVASSFVLRHYQDAVVESVPDPAAVLDRYPHAQVEILVRPGQRLSDNEDDVASHRLALVALAGRDRAEVLHRYEVAKDLLRFGLGPCD